ncbi:MAG TPA: hypothetical protein VFF65_08730, partial [Phycisphaerales bacterium]|nr:hypothetical protein [Phycisphaerales bacterium]
MDTVQRVKEGRGTPEDLVRVQELYYDSIRPDSTIGAHVANTLGQLPGFVGEFALTGGVGRGASLGTQAAIRGALPQALERGAAGAVTRLATRGAGASAGAAAQFALPGTLRAFDQAGDEAVFDGDIVSRLPSAMVNQYIEFLSERSGGALERIPGVNRLNEYLGGVARKWIGLKPGRTADDFLRAMKDRAGWHGVMGEVFEERVGDAMRAGTGLGEWSDVIPSQDQLAAEAIAFSLPGVAFNAATAVGGPRGGQQPPAALPQPQPQQPQQGEGPQEQGEQLVEGPPAVGSVPGPEVVGAEAGRDLAAGAGQGQSIPPSDVTAMAAAMLQEAETVGREVGELGLPVEDVSQLPPPLQAAYKRGHRTGQRKARREPELPDVEEAAPAVPSPQAEPAPAAGAETAASDATTTESAEPAPVPVADPAAAAAEPPSVTFRGIPPKEVRARLKAGGFAWDTTRRAWMGPSTPEGRALADTVSAERDAFKGRKREPKAAPPAAPATAAAATPSPAAAAAGVEPPAPKPKPSNAAKLRELAGTRETRADEVLGRERQTNTHRRATMAANVEATARGEKDAAEQMRRLADAIDAGQAPTLAGVKSVAQFDELLAARRRAQYDRWAKYIRGTPKERELQQEGKDWRHVELDEQALNSLAEGPEARVHGRTWLDFIEEVAKLPKSKQVVTRFRREFYGRDSDVRLSGEARDLAATWAGKLSSHAAGSVREAVRKSKRLTELGIQSTEDLRRALQEFESIIRGAKRNEEDPIKKLERGLVGKTVGFDFFPTPAAMATDLVRKADVRSGQRVLEPSAGNGRLADAAKAAGADVDTIEISGELRKVLEAKGHRVVADDFETFEPADQYDRIVMNPPFSGGIDIEHVHRAYGMLKPGGRLAAIMSEGVFFRSDKKAAQFREWLDQVGASIEQHEEGAFAKDLQGLPSTGTRTREVIIDKPEGETGPASKLDAIEEAAKRRMAKRTVRPKGRGKGVPGGSTLPGDLVDVAIIAAVRVVKAGVRTVQAIRGAVAAAAGELGRKLTEQEGADVRREAWRVVREAGKDGASIESAVAAARERHADAAAAGELPAATVKSRTINATGQRDAGDVVAVSTREALRSGMKGQERAGRAGFAAGVEEGKARAAAAAAPRETLKQRLARISGLTDDGDAATVSKREALTASMRAQRRAARDAWREATRVAGEKAEEQIAELRASVKDAGVFRKRVVKLVSRLAPPDMAKRFLAAAASVKSEKDVDAVAERLLLALAEHRARLARAEALKLVKRLDPAKAFEEDVRKQMTEAGEKIVALGKQLAQERAKAVEAEAAAAKLRDENAAAIARVRARAGRAETMDRL